MLFTHLLMVALPDSALGLGWSPGKSCLQENISRIQASTWQRITRVLVGWAKAEGLEKGRKIRVDATAVESDIRHPLDSQLLYDSVRKVTALLGKLADPAGPEGSGR